MCLAQATSEFNHPVGQTFALLAALTWATGLVLFKRSGEYIPPVALNLFKNTVGLVLLVATLIGCVLLGQDTANIARHLGPDEILLLAASGIIGIAVADSLFFYALKLIGVGLISIADCAYSPFVILFAWWLWDEQLTWVHYIGAALTISGVFIASRHKPPANRTRGQIAGGMLLAAVAVAMMAFGIVVVQQILPRVSVLWATTIRMAAGMVILVPLAMLGPRWKDNWTILRPSHVWRYAIPASCLGTYFAMMFWVAGFRYTYATVAGVLNQTSVILATILAVIFLRESLGVRQVIALILAAGGVVVVTFAEAIAASIAGPGPAALPG